jgi:2-dehydro-3-deoxyphosphogluconate aldolase / (4S)-4-hydroxy-2-oxoglutarate aldolase
MPTRPTTAGRSDSGVPVHTTQGIADSFRKSRLIPVIVIDDVGKAVPLAHALEEGGLPCAEITFRTPRALEALEKISTECPNVLLGAGTVLTPRQAADAHSAGAKFVVAPGFGAAMVDYCVEHDIPVFPGIATPTEMEFALSRGLSVMKFFPAESLGGIAYLKAMSAPYGDIGFLPSGGIGLSNMSAYLASPRVVACGGSWMAPADWIAAGQFDRIRDEVRKSVEAARAVNQEVH